MDRNHYGCCPLYLGDTPESNKIHIFEFEGVFTQVNTNSKPIHFIGNNYKPFDMSISRSVIAVDAHNSSDRE